MLRPGDRIRVAVYRLLPSYPPDVLNGMSVHVIGGLLGNDMVDPDPADVEAAERLINERGRRARDAIKGLRDAGALEQPASAGKP